MGSGPDGTQNRATVRIALRVGGVLIGLDDSSAHAAIRDYNVCSRLIRHLSFFRVME